MKKISLKASPRVINGRQVKKIRSEGWLPVNIYGRNIKSQAAQVKQIDFQKTHTEAGGTGLVELLLDGKTHPVLIKNIQYHPVNRVALHADLYQVDLTQKVRANIPLKISGTAPAVTQKVGVILELIDEVEVEALPADLPEAIMVDVSNLAQVDDVVKVSDLQTPKGVDVLTEKETEVVKIGELISKEAEALAEEDAAKAAAAAAEKTAPATTEPTVAPATAEKTAPETPKK